MRIYFHIRMMQVSYPEFIVVVEVFSGEVPPMLRWGALFNLAVVKLFLIVLVQ